MRFTKSLASVLALAAALCAATGFAVADPVTAARPPLAVSVQGEPFTDRPTRALSALDFAPGSSATTLLGLRSGVDDAVAVSLQLRLGATPGNAALRRAATVTVAASDAQGRPGARLWTGSVDSLRDATRVGVVLPPGGDGWVRVTATVPVTAGNEVAAQGVDFGMRIALSEAGLGVASIDVGNRPGARGGTRSGTAGSTGVLGSTGAPLALFVVAAGLALCAGATTLLAARVRRRPGPAPAR